MGHVWPYRSLLHAAWGPGAVGARAGVLLVGGWWRRHTAALGVHPAVDVVGDVAPGDTTHRAHRHGQRLAAFQHLRTTGRTVDGLQRLIIVGFAIGVAIEMGEGLDIANKVN